MKKTVATIIFLSASMLQGQEVRFGAQGTLAFPVGDAGQSEFLNHRPAFGFGVNAIWNFHPRHVFVPRFDMTFYKRNFEGNNTNPLKSSATLSDIKLGVDYNLITKFNGFYGIAGLGLSSFDWMGDDVARDKKTALYFALGAGYPLTNNFLAELRYTHASYTDVTDDLGRRWNRSAPAINLSLMWRY
ncbi:MAG: porin family protein [Holophagaceae bacterium]|nr:porin family protein [Holophagaceae bacterium]